MNFPRTRNGLIYELDEPDTWRYQADGVFFVDGIRYDPWATGVHSIRTMCSVIRDPQNGRPLGCTFHASRPPTEHELDTYVRFGQLPR